RHSLLPPAVSPEARPPPETTWAHPVLPVHRRSAADMLLHLRYPPAGLLSRFSRQPVRSPVSVPVGGSWLRGLHGPPQIRPQKRWTRTAPSETPSDDLPPRKAHS